MFGVLVCCEFKISGAKHSNILKNRAYSLATTLIIYDSLEIISITNENFSTHFT